MEAPVGYLRLRDKSVIRVYPDDRIRSWSDLTGRLAESLTRASPSVELTVSSEGERRRVELDLITGTPSRH